MRTGGRGTQHGCHPLSCRKSARAEPAGPLAEAARAHLSPKRPLGPGDAYEADVEPEVAPGCGDTLAGWLHHLLPAQGPAVGTGTGGPGGATAPGVSARPCYAEG